MSIRTSKRRVKSQLDTLEKAVNDRNDIERGLLLIVFLAIIFLGWQTYFFDSLKREKKNIDRQIQTVEAEHYTINSRLEAVLKGMEIDPLKPLKEKRNKLRVEIAGLTKTLEGMTSDLVSEEEMRALLVSVLEHAPRVQMQSIENLEGITLSGIDENSELAQYALSLFKHGMVVNFSGDYFSTLSFLEKLENLDQKLIWDSITYEVTDYPEARVTILVRTISDSEGWIGV